MVDLVVLLRKPRFGSLQKMIQAGQYYHVGSDVHVVGYDPLKLGSVGFIEDLRVFLRPNS